MFGTQADRPKMTNRIYDLAREATFGAGNGGAFGPDDDLRALGLTSMAMVRLMLAAEAAFDISIPDEELRPENFQSVRAIEALVSRLAA
jgi:acyl carrier protein